MWEEEGDTGRMGTGDLTDTGMATTAAAVEEDTTTIITVTVVDTRTTDMEDIIPMAPRLPLGAVVEATIWEEEEEAEVGVTRAVALGPPDILLIITNKRIRRRLIARPPLLLLPPQPSAPLDLLRLLLGRVLDRDRVLLKVIMVPRIRIINNNNRVVRCLVTIVILQMLRILQTQILQILPLESHSV
jgi:hypothetical protein